jgi:hypothetical protein
LVSDHLQRLQAVYDHRFAREHGPWRPVVAQVADTFLAIWTQWLDSTLLAPVPHRQVVLTIPKRRRAYCRYRRRLLGEIARVAARTLTAAIRTLIGERDLAVGIVACLQTHGSRAHWHLPLHLLVTDGGFRPDGTCVTWPASRDRR